MTEAEMARKAAERIVDVLMEDLDDRSRFDLGGVDKEARAEWREDWIKLVLEEMP